MVNLDQYYQKYYPVAKKSAFVAQQEPSATKLNGMIKPEFASLNGFTLTAKRPTYADSKASKQKDRQN